MSYIVSKSAAFFYCSWFVLGYGNIVVRSVEKWNKTDEWIYIFILANEMNESHLPLCDENAEVLGFGGSFGVVSPGEKLGEVFELKKQHQNQTTNNLSNRTNNLMSFNWTNLGFRLIGGADVIFGWNLLISGKSKDFVAGNELDAAAVELDEAFVSHEEDPSRSAEFLRIIMVLVFGSLRLCSLRPSSL